MSIHIDTAITFTVYALQQCLLQLLNLYNKNKIDTVAILKMTRISIKDQKTIKRRFVYR